MSGRPRARSTISKETWMNDALRAAAAPAAAPTMSAARAPTRGGGRRPPDLARSSASGLSIARAETATAAQLRRCFPRWTRTLEQLTSQALTRLADNQPIDPNDPDVWRNRDAHAQAVLHRHGLGRVNASRLTSAAIAALIDGQAQADRDAGLDWTTLTVAGERARRAASPRAREAADHPRGPAVWAYRARPAPRPRRPARTGGRAGRRAVALGAGPPRPVRRRGPALLADRLRHLADARRRAARPGRTGSTGRSACSSSRRSGRRRLAADAGALARDDPPDRRARRTARARPALSGAADRRPRAAARTDQPPHAARRPEGVP